MKRHPIALITLLALLASMASIMSLKPALLAASMRQNSLPNPPQAFDETVVQQVFDRSSAVVRAKVIQVNGVWSPDHLQIQSQITLKIHYNVRGALHGALIIQTVGGHLPTEGLSMMASDAPLFSEGEEVILFLTRNASTYALVAGHNGKYLVENGMVQQSGSLNTESLDSFYARLGQFDTNLTLPQDWLTHESQIGQSATIAPSDFAYKGMKWALDTVSFRINLNSAHMAGDDGSASDFLDAIRNAAATWTNEATAAFSLVYAGPTESTNSTYNGSNDIYFENRGLFDESGVRRPLAVATVWYSNDIILDTDIWINDAYDWDATGLPAWTELDLESVVLHELGHWLSLGHDADSRAVMYYAMMSGALKRTLFENDRNGIAFIYPCELDEGCNPAPTVTPTLQATATPTVSPTATPTVPPSATPSTATPTATAVSVLITSRDGGMLEYVPESGSQVILVAPPGAVTTDTVITIAPVSSTPVLSEPLTLVVNPFHIGAGPAGREREEITFQTPITLTISYSITVERDLPEERIHLLMLSEGESSWEELPCTHQNDNAETHRVTTSISHPAVFGLFRSDNNTLYLPAITK